MVLGRDSTGLEASDQMGQMDKAGSQVCLEWAQEVQALVIKMTFYCADPVWLPVSEHRRCVCLRAGRSSAPRTHEQSARARSQLQGLF